MALELVSAIGLGPTAKWIRRRSISTAVRWRMETGRPLGQPVLFDRDGKLNDAQHRLWASVVSGSTFETYADYRHSGDRKWVRLH